MKPKFICPWTKNKEGSSEKTPVECPSSNRAICEHWKEHEWREACVCNNDYWEDSCACEEVDDE